MNEGTFLVVIKTLAEQIESLECQNNYLRSKVDTLEEELGKYKGETVAQDDNR